MTADQDELALRVDLEALERRVKALEGRLAALDPEAVARRALEILRTDPLLQAQLYTDRIKATNGGAL